VERFGSRSSFDGRKPVVGDLPNALQAVLREVRHLVISVCSHDIDLSFISMSVQSVRLSNGSYRIAPGDVP
jgi:hypothetical protein